MLIYKEKSSGNVGDKQKGDKSLLSTKNRK